MTARRVLVTGGASGVGEAVALALLEESYEVVVADLREPVIAGVGYRRADLADPDSVRALAEAEAGELYGLVNAAGVPGTLPAETVMAVNFSGLRMLTELCVERAESLASVVHVSSLSAAAWADNRERLAPLLRTQGYSAAQEFVRTSGLLDEESYVFSKQAVIMLTQWQAATWLRRGVRVNCVSPGPIETRLLADFKQSMGEAHIDQAIELQGRAATPADIAPVIAFLLGEQAGWVSGSDIHTDGGLHAVREYARTSRPPAAASN